jgi:hypothetical protein
MANVEEIFVLAQCARCHAPGGLADYEGGLRLTAGTAHDSLVDVSAYTGIWQAGPWGMDPVGQDAEREWIKSRAVVAGCCKRVVPGKPDQSWILVRAHPDAPATIRTIDGRDGHTEVMYFRMPQGKGPLPMEWYQLLVDWVAAGAPK